MRLSKKELSERIERNCGTEFSLTEEYKNSYSPVKIRHNSPKCNYFEWDTVPKNTFLKKPPLCPICSGKVISHKRDSFITKDKLPALFGPEFTIMPNQMRESKRSAAIEIQHNCDTCNNYRFYISPNTFIKYRDQGIIICPECRRIDKAKTMPFRYKEHKIAK